MKKYISTLKAHRIKKDLEQRLQLYKQLVEIGLSPQETFTTYKVNGKVLRAGVTNAGSPHCFVKYDQLPESTISLNEDLRDQVSKYINGGGGNS